MNIEYHYFLKENTPMHTNESLFLQDKMEYAIFYGIQRYASIFYLVIISFSDEVVFHHLFY